MMNGKIIIGGVVVLLCLIGGIFFWQKISEPTQLPAKPTKELKLSDFPEAFKEKTVIVLGDNASEIERQAAEEIKNFLVEHNSSYIKVIDSQKIENFKKGYNLVIIGTPKTNPLLEEVYALTNATRVTEEFPGEGKGVLEILPNPWDESKAMLLVEGGDEWGVKAGSEMLEQVQMLDLNEANYKVRYIKLEDFITNGTINSNRTIIIDASPRSEVKIKIPITEEMAKNILQGRIQVKAYGDLKLSDISVKPPMVIFSYLPSAEGKYIKFVAIGDELVEIWIYCYGVFKLPNEEVGK